MSDRDQDSDSDFDEHPVPMVHRHAVVGNAHDCWHGFAQMTSRLPGAVLIFLACVIRTMSQPNCAEGKTSGHYTCIGWRILLRRPIAVGMIATFDTFVICLVLFWVVAFMLPRVICRYVPHALFVLSLLNMVL